MDNTVTLPGKPAVAGRFMAANFLAYPPVGLVGVREVVLGLLGVLDTLHHLVPDDLEALLQVGNVLAVLTGPAEGEHCGSGSCCKHGRGLRPGGCNGTTLCNAGHDGPHKRWRLALQRLHSGEARAS